MCYFCVATKRSDRARTECGGGAAKKESIVRIGSSLHIDCHYIIFRHRASPLAVIPHELIPCVRVLDTAAFSVQHIIKHHTRTVILFLYINCRLDEYIFLLLPQKIDESFFHE
jgi:hypothetical protein